MEIRQHATNNKCCVVIEPTEDALKLAKRLESGNWAKIHENGKIIIHINVRKQFEALMQPKSVAQAPVAVSPVAPEFTSRDEMMTWLWENINSSKVVSYIERGPLGHKRWNELYAGKMTAKQIEEKYSENANS